MSEVQRLLIEENGEAYEIYIESKETPQISTSTQGDGRQAMGNGNADVKMQQARQMIRAYTMYALSAFKDFALAEIEEVNLKFGLKIGGKAGIPYITEGSAESNLEISVTCRFPKR